jgi:hypothetical protein
MSKNENSPVNVTKPVFVQVNGQYFKVSVNKTTVEEASKGTYKPPTPEEVGVVPGGRRNKRKATRHNKRKGTRRNKRKGTRRNKRKGTRRNKRN